MKKRYPNLSFVCEIYYFLGALIMAISLVIAIALIYLWTQTPPFSGLPLIFPIIIAIVVVLLGFSITIGMFALVDFFRCIMDIEENTRKP